MLAKNKSAVNRRPYVGRNRKVLRPGIAAICRESDRSRQHVTEVLRGRRKPSAHLARIIHQHGLTWQKKSRTNG